MSVGASKGPGVRGEWGETHDGGEGLQAEGQASPLRTGEQHRWDQGGEYGCS